MSILLLVLLLVIVGVLFAFKSNKIEMPAYSVIKKYGAVEIRQYPNMVVAQTMLLQSTQEQKMSAGFRTIAGYIFGANTNLPSLVFLIISSLCLLIIIKIIYLEIVHYLNLI